MENNRITMHGMHHNRRLQRGLIGLIMPVLVFAFASLVMLNLPSVPLRAQTAPATTATVKGGTISGTVVDAKSGQPVIGANVLLVGSDPIKGAVADIDGNFTIRKVTPGTYSVKITSVGYTTIQVQDVIVKEGADAKLGLKMEEQIADAGEITVTAKAVQGNEVSMIRERQASKATVDAISSQTISRSGASDAAEATSKVVGATVVDGKFIYVRGLGDRYSNTQLNGSLMPTPDPEKQAVPLDMIPSGLLDNIVVTKTFTPDKPGNFSGGSVDLRTKDFPEKQLISASVGSGHNNLSTSDERFLSFVAGPQTVDPLWNTDRAVALGNDPNRFTSNPAIANLMDSLTRTFEPNVGLTRRKAPFNRNYSLSYGNNLQLFSMPIGINASYNSNTSFSQYKDGIQATYRVENAPRAGEVAVPYIQRYYHDTKSTEEFLSGALASLAISPIKNNKLVATWVRTDAEETESRYLNGSSPSSFNVQPNEFFPTGDTASTRVESNVLRFTDRQLDSWQFKGDHHLNLGLKFLVNWGYSSSVSKEHTPDMRFFAQGLYPSFPDSGDEAFVTISVWPDTTYLIEPTTTQRFPSRVFRDIREENSETKVDLTMPWVNKDGKPSQGSFKLGFHKFKKFRDSRDQIFSYTRNITSSDGTWYDGTAEDYADSPGFDTLGTLYIFNTGPENNLIINATTGNSSYRGVQDISSFYWMSEFPVLRDLNIIAGLRYEATDMFTENGYEPTAQQYVQGRLKQTNLLPAVNVVYHLSPNVNLRGAVTTTLARPTLREFAPFKSEDFIGALEFEGNSKLKQTTINNYDLRWEWFPRAGEVIAVSAFSKRFTNPIELEIDNNNFSFYVPVNTDEAVLYGLELEARTRLDVLNKSLSGIEIGANLTLVDSRVNLPESEFRVEEQYYGNTGEVKNYRPLYGQSPYVLNGSFGYSSDKLAADFTVSVNRFGKRLWLNSPAGTPDVYEQSRTSLNITAGKKILGGLEIRGKAKNILGDDFVAAHDITGDIAVRRDIGREFSLGVNWKL